MECPKCGEVLPTMSGTFCAFCHVRIDVDPQNQNVQAEASTKATKFDWRDALYLILELPRACIQIAIAVILVVCFFGWRFLSRIISDNFGDNGVEALYATAKWGSVALVVALLVFGWVRMLRGK